MFGANLKEDFPPIAHEFAFPANVKRHKVKNDQLPGITGKLLQIYVHNN